jgi:predicted phosphodiesterase
MKLLITGDRHLREDTPTCRLDDYWVAQERKVQFINRIYLAYDYPLVCLDAGDLLNKWRVSPYLETWLIRNLQKPLYTILGTELHTGSSMEVALERSSTAVLEAAGIIHVRWNDHPIEIGDVIVYNSMMNGAIPKKPIDKNRFNILLCHTLIWEGEVPYPGAEKEGSPANRFLRTHDFDLIVSGHNHQTICIEKDGRWLINPGSMMRMTASQVNHKPCVFIFDTETRKVEQIFLPIEEGVVSREHISMGEERDSRVSAFVTKLRDDVEFSLSFRKNLEEYMEANNVRVAVREKVWRAVDGNN